MRSWLRIHNSLTCTALPHTLTRSYATSSRSNQTLTLQDGRTLGYAVYGDPNGFPLLYFHGYPSSRLEGSSFEPLVQARNIRLIAPDRPGYGLSTFQKNRRVIDYPADIRSLLRHLGMPKFAVLGGSGGGPYALACAHSMSEELAGVGVLAGAGPWAAGRQHVSTLRRMLSYAATHYPRALRLILDAHIYGARWAMATKPGVRYLDRWMESQESPEQAGLSTERRREMVLAMLFEAFAQGSGAMVQEAVLLTHDWGFRFEDISYNRVRIWHGEDDKQSPIEMIRYMAKRIPHCKLTTYKGETHFTVSAHLEEIVAELVPDELIRKHTAVRL